MGINGLLPYLKPIQKDKNISQYRNMTVAIDSYCWLHKAIYSCALDIANNVQTDKYVIYCLRKIELLLSYNIRPVVIFDGGPLPSKQKTETDRENSREQNRKKAIEYLNAGDTRKAAQKFGESIDVTPQLAFNLYKALRDRYKVECIVAPYEADAQLAYLSRIGYVDVIITEDSDLLSFGAKKVFYKMDGMGNGKEIDIEDIRTVRGDVPVDLWSQNLFLSACIFAGCDYLSSIKGIGFKKAYKLMGDNKNYKNVLKQLKLEGKHIVPQDYEDKFERALLTFKFQRVFCPIKKCLVNVNELDLDNLDNETGEMPKNLTENPDDIDHIVEKNLVSKVLSNGNLDFLGPDMSVELAQKIAYGVIDPVTRRPYLTEAETAAPQSLSWPSGSDQPSGNGISSAPNFPRPVLLAADAGGKLEDEFSMKAPVPSFTQFNRNNDKSKYFKVAKPKLVTQKSSDAHTIMSSQQRGIKDFFKGGKNSGSASVSHSIRTFFLPKKPESETLKGQDEDSKLLPTTAFEDSEPDFRDEDDKTRMEEEEDIMSRRKEVMQEEEKFEIKPPVEFKKFSAFSNGFDLFKNDGMEFTYHKGSKNLNKAFKVPSLKKDQREGDGQEETQAETQTQAEAESQSTIANETPNPLKRKAEDDIRTSFDAFAFKKVKKIESLTLKKYEDRFEAKLGGKDSVPKKKPSPMIPEVLPKQINVGGAASVVDRSRPTIEGLNGFMFTTAKKPEKKMTADDKRTIYKINLSTRNSSNDLPVDIQSLYNINSEEEGKIKDFFKMNPIDKVELKDRFFGRDLENFEMSSDIYQKDDLDNKVSSFLLKFK